MGSIFKMKTYHPSDSAECIKELKSLGYSIFAANYHENSVDLRNYKFPKKSVLIIGCEGDGVQPEIDHLSDKSLHIEMDEGIDSLNAAVASGIFLHHMCSN